MGNGSQTTWTGEGGNNVIMDVWSHASSFHCALPQKLPQAPRSTPTLILVLPHQPPPPPRPACLIKLLFRKCAAVHLAVRPEVALATLSSSHQAYHHSHLLCPLLESVHFSSSSGPPPVSSLPIPLPCSHSTIRVIIYHTNY